MLFCSAVLSWTWLQGDKLVDPHGSKNNPGGRSGTTTFLQSDRSAIWMFGGERKAGQSPTVTSDLWKLDITTFQWTLVHNGTAKKDKTPGARQLAAGCGIQSLYFVMFGGLGENGQALGDTWIYYIPESKWYTLEAMQQRMGVMVEGNKTSPPARGDAAVWCQDGKNLVMFGGFGSDNKLRHDMWVFSLSTMTWMQMESSSKLPADPSFIKHLISYPDGRSGATTWNSHDNFYMYGGNLQHNNVRSKHLNTGNSGDMWLYNLEEDNWKLLSGHKGICTRTGEFGVKDRPSYINRPGCRRRATAWVDSRQNLWMFGGDGADVSQESMTVIKKKLLSDLWHFNTETKLWTWKGGRKDGDQAGHFGDLGEANDNFVPGSRCEAMYWSVWNYLFLFGGVGHDINGKGGYLNDIWKLDIHNDPSIRVDNPGAGSVFGIIFLGVGLVVVLVVLNFFLRGRFQDNSISSVDARVGYSPLAFSDQ